MASKHKSAPWFLKQGFFEGIKSFKEFEARTGKLADTVEMGDALEILVEAYLHLDKVLKAKDVWVVGSIPLYIRKALNLPNDSKGIDGVYEDQAGNYIPYQVKYRTDMDTLPYGEISPFLGITEKSLQDRLIFTNARKLSIDVANRTGVRSVRADKFNELTETDFKRIHAWLADKKVEPVTRYAPLTHQREAIEKITAALKEADRTTAVMACGTGKTLVALWAAEAQQPKTVLVLVPSLALLSQTLPDWCKQTSWGERFRYICVCSDDSVDREAQQDRYTYKQEDLEFSVTTDAKEVKKFLGKNKDGVNVIFSTYQSAEVVAEGLKGQTVDLGIFDEAHKTTGDKEGLFAFGLSDKNIRIKKRLFLTATPRHYKLNKRDKDGDFQVVSMNDEAVYGKVSYRLPFSAAVAAGIIVPYKVIISVSLNKEVDDELLRRGSTQVRRDEIQAKWVANQIALKRAIEKTGASKIITFHSRVNLAEEFAGDSSRGIKEHVKGFDVFHVNGGQNAADRKALLEDFKASPRGLITNARCLTEGVDVPAVDMVAFVDPRKSKIDIAQAAGRAMRQSKATNKKLGYIVVPLFIEQKKGETEAEAFTRAGFDEVAEVLGAMLESDDDLVDTIEKMQEARGRGDKFNPRQLHEKIEVIGPAINLDKLTQSIDVEILDSLGFSWDKSFGILKKFREREGHCRVPYALKTDGFNLGGWVSTQRSYRSKGWLDQERIERLNSIGFSWDPVLEEWEKGYSALQAFLKSKGHCRIPWRFEQDGFNLGSWATTQRTFKAKGQLNEERIKRLNALDFSWDPRADQWEMAFVALLDFIKIKGHCRVPQNFKQSGVPLGTWVNTQRSFRSKGKLDKDRQERLTAIGFIWDSVANEWEAGMEALLKFSKSKGHCRIPRNYKQDGIPLGSWAYSQRELRNEGRLSAERLERLNSLGFVWDLRSEDWGKNFEELKLFLNRHRHCRVPHNFKQGGVNLGSWVSTQRSLCNEGQLIPERKALLDSLGFTWDPILDQWKQSFAALAEFRSTEGHCRVPQGNKHGEVNLGSWVSTQRSLRDKGLLEHERVNLLNSLGFSWDPVNEKWEMGFIELSTFKNREGHCRVPFGFKQNNFNLGSWVNTQRNFHKKKQLEPERVDRLISLGFKWNIREEDWELGFSSLKDFFEKNGHCRVSRGVKHEGTHIGSWVATQRALRDKGRLDKERISLLNSIGFSWDPISEDWDKNFAALVEFYKKTGHCRVPQSFKQNGLKLGSWVSTQRTYHDSGQLVQDRVDKLNSISFSWDPRSEDWEEGFATLQIFLRQHGHCRVPLSFKLQGIQLGLWVSRQRECRKLNRLSSELISRLDTIGFIWKI